jgi:3-phosphoshikimate 1-carboxyvinyltransferase
MGDIPASEPRAIPAGGRAEGTVVAPPSKSHAIRALVCAALGGRESTVVLPRGPLPDDVSAAVRALADLGWHLEVDDDGEAIHVGRTDRVPPHDAATCDAGGSATAMRILAAVCALGPGPYTVGGTPQLLRRPAGAIVPALRALGVSVAGERSEGGGDRPPLVISGGPARGGEVVVDASASSHALSALLLVGPRIAGGLVVRPAGEVASRPYVDLTVEVMRACGATVVDEGGAWRVSPGGYPRANGQAVEGDWSSAAFLLGAAAATGGEVFVEGVESASAQADRRIVDVLGDFGAEAESRLDVAGCRGRVARPVDVDLRDAPDLAPLVGALACLVPGTSRVRGAAHLRIKETDRIAQVVRCARAWGCDARELPDGFEITGPARHGATIDPAGDHRLAMAFAVAGLAVPGTRIADPDCVGKSYPAFWSDLRSLL